LKILSCISLPYSIAENSLKVFFGNFWVGAKSPHIEDLEVVKNPWKGHILHSSITLIDGLVIGGDLVFTILQTYTSLKSGLNARKSESNLGDATISLRMVNEDTSWTWISLLCTFTH